MKHTPQGFTTRGQAGAPPPSKLADRRSLPRRAQLALERVLAATASHMGDGLKATFDALGQALQNGEVARSNEERNAIVDTLGLLRREQAALIARFVEEIESGLAALGADEPPRAEIEAMAAGAAPLPGELSLVDQGSLEEELALQGIATRGEVRHAEALFLLGHRFAVLVAQPILTPAALPIGPVRIGEALRAAIEPLGLRIDHRVSIYRLFDRVAMALAGAYYADVNEGFVEQRILPGLRPKRVATRLGGDAPPAAAGTTAAPKPATESDAAPAAATTVAAAGSPAVPAEPAATAAVPPQSPPVAVGAEVGALADSQRLYTHLCGLLKGERLLPAQRASADGVADGRAVQDALMQLQARIARQIGGDAALATRGVTHLKRDLVAQLRQMGGAGGPLALSREDGDTIDLVGMLFGHLTRSAGLGTAAQGLLSQLQLPLMRVALADPAFFTRADHPARKLLNTVIEAGERWIDDTDPDADLLLRLRQIVKQVAHGDAADLDALEELHKGLSGHVGVLTRRAEIAERRQIEAAKGRERLEFARRQSRAALTRMIERADPPAPLRDMLERTWAPVLALTLLRQGEDSAAYHRRLAVADQLLRRSSGDDRPVDQALRREVEDGLGQVGMHGEDVQKLTRALFDTAPSGEESAAAALSDITDRLGAWGRTPEDAPAAAASPAATPECAVPLSLSADEQQMLEQIKGLPFGTWFEFRTNQQGDTVRRKLAWFSTLTGRCLFVNQRGLRTHDSTLEQVARDMARRQLWPVPSERRTFVDRAWDTILSTLRRIAPGGDAAQLAPN
ncbi:MAG: hypothetical protein DI564_13675 [Rhodanobacter denitrificans]|uniref:DUF1631 domain-containing protein n=1 Tax=Rhodanobacter denitrificans TaxID=666685 RepID=A0A2W5M3M8_9GAMM|nr:MAG: hypothetical protein DI564_13675 [Rhodanobacter denitrificans]